MHEPISSPIEIYTPDWLRFEAANAEIISGEPLAKATKVTPARFSDIFSDLASWVRLGQAYFSAVFPINKKSNAIIRIYAKVICMSTKSGIATALFWFSKTQ